jgi:hypothetical protein
MRMPQHDVRNDGYGPYVMFYCEKCQREYHSTAKAVTTIAQDTAKSVFGGLLRNIPLVGDAVADSVDNNTDRYRTSMTDQELNAAWAEVQSNFRECPTCHMVVCIPDFDEVSGFCRDDSPRSQEIAQAQAEQAGAVLKGFANAFGISDALKHAQEEAQARRMSQAAAQAAGLICPQCHSAVQPGQKFCGTCGAPMAPPEVACPKCGTLTSTNFCPNCGTKVR